MSWLEGMSWGKDSGTIAAKMEHKIKINKE
jgi:hypothetical protein